MKVSKLLLLAGCAALTLGTTNLSAQDNNQGGGRRNFDPAQMRQRMIENYRESMGVKDDAEWKVIEAQITKVMEARMAVMGPGMRGMMGRRGGNNADRPERADRTNRVDRAEAGDRPSPFGAPSAAQEALQKAVDAKAPSAEIKTKLDAYRAEIKTKEEKLTQAQEDLKKLLTPQQEAAAVLGGLLK